MQEETIVFVENLQPISCCRICHEEELEISKKLEAPCACTGTTKFAHRECIQRWCDVKGDTTCEICLQKYEPGYTAPPKKAQVVEEEVVTIISFPIEEDEEDEEEDDSTFFDTEFLQCWFQSISCCKLVALILTAILLVRHLLVLYGEVGHSPFPLIITVLALRVCGIVIPMYIIIRTITRIQRKLRRRLQYHLIRRREHEPEHSIHITVDIQSI